MSEDNSSKDDDLAGRLEIVMPAEPWPENGMPFCCVKCNVVQPFEVFQQYGHLYRVCQTCMAAGPGLNSIVQWALRVARDRLEQERAARQETPVPTEAPPPKKKGSRSAAKRALARQPFPPPPPSD